jgi:hypothetical protein
MGGSSGSCPRRLPREFNDAIVDDTILQGNSDNFDLWTRQMPLAITLPSV